jgi:dethiobiotin synthetase
VTVAVTPNLARSNVVVVTGTDTAVGKTWVTCALARAIRAAGHSVVAIKPVDTGCATLPRDAEDGVRLAAATGQREPAEALIRLAAPVTPALAAEREGAAIDFDDVLLRLEGLAQQADIALIEGSGGLLAPIGWEWNLVDLAQALDARAVLVGRDRLGTLSHALLTLSALELGGIPVAGVVLTPPTHRDGSTGTNGATLGRLSGQTGIIEVPETADPAEAAPAMAPLVTRILGIRQ